MNPLLVELSPDEIQAVVAVRRRLQGRLERLLQSADELAERRPLLEKWLDYPKAPAELEERAGASWESLRASLTAEREALARTHEEQRRAAAITREAVALLSSFLDLASSGLEAPAANGSALTEATDEKIASARRLDGSSSRSPTATAARPPAEPTALVEWRTLARLSLDQSGPLHYKEIYRRLRAHGVVFGGAHPAGTFLATINRDSAFVRVGRGVYWVAGEPLPETPSAHTSSSARARRTSA